MKKVGRKKRKKIKKGNEKEWHKNEKTINKKRKKQTTMNLSMIINKRCRG